MPYLDHVLQPPSYGWADGNGKLIKPSVIQILKEFFTRLNVVSDRKNWLPFFSWLKVFCLLPFFFIFLFNFLHIWTVLAAFVYSMIIVIVRMERTLLKMHFGVSLLKTLLSM